MSKFGYNNRHNLHAYVSDTNHLAEPPKLACGILEQPLTNICLLNLGQK